MDLPLLQLLAQQSSNQNISILVAKKTERLKKPIYLLSRYLYLFLKWKIKSVFCCDKPLICYRLKFEATLRETSYLKPLFGYVYIALRRSTIVNFLNSLELTGSDIVFRFVNL